MNESGHDEPVESGALEDEGEGSEKRPPRQKEPVESGALEDDEA